MPEKPGAAVVKTTLPVVILAVPKAALAGVFPKGLPTVEIERMYFSVE